MLFVGDVPFAALQICLAFENLLLALAFWFLGLPRGRQFIVDLKVFQESRGRVACTRARASSRRRAPAEPRQRDHERDCDEEDGAVMEAVGYPCKLALKVVPCVEVVVVTIITIITVVARVDISVITVLPPRGGVLASCCRMKVRLNRNEEHKDGADEPNRDLELACAWG